MRTTILAALALFPALHAFGQTTTIEVPQGSGVFPTVGQINCLEDVGGRYCAASWECGDESGTLWGDMANHDGMRVLGVTSPVARRRGCAIEVDGAAEAAWFTAYAPDRGNAAIGLSPVPNPPAPVVRRIVDPIVAGGSLVEWMIAEHGLDIAAARRAVCSHLRDDASQDHRDRCENQITATAAELLHLMATPFTMCAVELMVELGPDILAAEGDRWEDDSAGNWILRPNYAVLSPELLFGGDAREAFGKCRSDLGGALRRFRRDWPELREHHERCCDLYREEAASVGFHWPSR